MLRKLRELHDLVNIILRVNTNICNIVTRAVDVMNNRITNITDVIARPRSNVLPQNFTGGISDITKPFAPYVSNGIVDFLSYKIRFFISNFPP